MNKQIKKLKNFIESQSLCKADIIVWLQGDRFDRGKKVLELYRAGYSNLILLTGNNELIGKGKRMGEDNVSLVDMEKWLIKNKVKKIDILVESNSMNTHDQAVNVLRLAQNKKWKSIILVGSTHHQLRAFLTFLKQAKKIDWQGKITNQPVKIDLDDVPSGRDKTSKEIFNDELLKLDLYDNCISSVEDGISYLK